MLFYNHGCNIRYSMIYCKIKREIKISRMAEITNLVNELGGYIEDDIIYKHDTSKVGIVIPCLEGDPNFYIFKNVVTNWLQN